jgi:uncharacterized membrane protein (UPF0136 family)
MTDPASMLRTATASSESPDLPGVTIRPFEARDAVAWNAFVRRHPAHAFTHLRAICDLMPEWRTGPEVSLVAHDASGELLAVLPLFLLENRLLGVIRDRRLAAAAISGSGPLLAPELAPAAARSLLAALERASRCLGKALGASSIGMPLPVVAGDRSVLSRHRFHPLRPFGWQEELVPVIVADLTPTEDRLLAACQRSTRARIRQADASGARVRPVRDRSEWMALEQANRWTQGEAALSTAAMARVWDDLVQPGDAFTIAVEYEEQLISALVITVVNRVAHYFLSFNSPESHKHSANRLALWHAMQEAKRRGLHWFEFGPVYWGDGKDASIARFKESFGGTIWYQTNASYELAPIRATALRVAVQGYRALRARSPRRAVSDDA